MRLPRGASIPIEKQDPIASTYSLQLPSHIPSKGPGVGQQMCAVSQNVIISSD